jgi:hypothetical protein
LVQHLCSGALYGPAKGKANILIKLAKVLPNAIREKKTTVEKHIFSLLNKLSEEPKGELIPILRELISLTLSLGGEEAYSALRQSAKNLVTN